MVPVPLVKVRQKFEEYFKRDPEFFVRSPGRVNLIGEHTDYNDGFVLPAAIDKGIMFGFAPNGTRLFRCYSIDKDEHFETELDTEEFDKSPLGWPNYFLGVLEQLRKGGNDIEGFDCVFGGDLPIGAGLSSSAALEDGMLFGLNSLFALDLDSLDMVRMGQKAENEFVGVQCGIMDQFANIFGRAQYVFKLDCRSFDYEYYPFKTDDIHIVLCDTGVRRELASSEYNIRRKQCEEGIRILNSRFPGIVNLRDVKLDQLEEMKNEMDEIIYNRCKYVIEEDDRVEKGCNDLEKGDLEAFGEKMFDSHTGLRDLYEVSCSELDILVEAALGQRGVLGARMMGAGFGGCTINLVKNTMIEEFSGAMKKIYEDKTGRPLKVYRMQIANGTGLITTGKTVNRVVKGET